MSKILISINLIIITINIITKMKTNKKDIILLILNGLSVIINYVITAMS